MRDDEALAWAGDELLALVGIGSTSGHEHAAVHHLEERCAAWGLPARRLPVGSAADDLVIGWAAEPRLLLTAHIDTIVPEWEWTAAREGDRVRGVGAGDDKGSIVASALGMVLAREQGISLEDLPVALGVCTDEELTGLGSIAMATALRPEFVVAGEPSRLRIGVAEAGFVDARYRVLGRSVHGSFPELGDNAIEKMARMIVAVHEEPFAQVTHPLLGRNVPGALQIEGGGDLHVIPGRASTRIEVRVVPGGPSATEIEARMRQIAADHDAEVELVEPSVEPFETDPGGPLVHALQDAVEVVCGSRAEEIGVPAWTDAHNFVDLAGAQAVVWGPGDFELAHDADEAIDLHQVVTAARVVERLLTDAKGWLS